MLASGCLFILLSFPLSHLSKHLLDLLALHYDNDKILQDHLDFSFYQNMETATHQGSLISFSKKWNYRSNLCMSICMNAGARKTMKKNVLWANSMIELEKLSFHIMISYRYLKFNFKYISFLI